MKKILKFIFICLLIFLIILLYARYIGTSEFIVKEDTIVDKDINSFDGLKIVHFSDVNFLRDGNTNKIKKMVKEINMLNPDIVISSGNLINNKVNLNDNDIKELTHLLNNINSKYGKYAVLGKNDLSKKDVVTSIYLNSKFNLLDDSYDIIYKNTDKIFIGGINPVNNNIDKVLSYKEDTGNIFKIIITSYGDYADNIIKKDSNTNLILSGNSLNGSINIPYIKKLFLPIGSKKYYNNKYKLNNTNLYVSSGIGENKITLRLFNSPSINLYRINKNTD